MSLRVKIILTGLVLSGILGAYKVLGDVNRSIVESYAVWWVAEMVVEHMKANDDRWPSSWDDLEDDYETCVERSGRPWTFEQLKSRTIVDWDVDVDELRTSAVDSDAPEFRVIRTRSGSNDHWKHAEPNMIIWEYLRSSAEDQ